MRILTLALKDIQQLLRDKMSALFLVIMPIVFTFFFGSLFGASPSDTRLAIGLLDEDPGGVMSVALSHQLEQSSAIRLVELTGKDPDWITGQVAHDKLAGAVLIPAGYSQANLSGSELPFRVIIRPGSSSEPTIKAAIRAAALQVSGSLQAARLSLAAAEAVGHTFSNDAERTAYIVSGFKLASQAWDQPAVSLVSQAETAQAVSQQANGYTQSSPGMLVQFSIFGLVLAGTLLVVERQTRVIDRLITANVSRAEILAGHLLAFFVVCFLQQALLIGIAQAFLGVDYLRQPWATLLLMTAMALMTGALGLLLGTAAKRAEQVTLMGMGAMFLLSALGGAWFPLETTGKTFAMIGHLTPIAWAMDGFQNIIQRGLDFQSIILPCSVLMGYALVFFTLGVLSFGAQRS